jgi:predicted phosphodiesterase
VSRPLGVHLGPTERDEIRQALARGDGVATVARRLGHSPNTVRRVRDEPAPVAVPPEGSPSAQAAAKLHGLLAEAEPPGPVYRAIVAQVMADLEARGLLSSPQVAAPPPPAPADPPPLPPAGRSHVVREDGTPERVLFLSDLHVPFHDSVAWQVAMRAMEDFKPQVVLLAGDMFDCYSISVHDKDPGRADTLQDEFDAGRPLWQELEDRCGGARVIYWKGNHEERIDRLTREKPGLFNLRCLEIPIAAEMPKRWSYYPNQTRYRLGALSCLHGDLKGRGTAVMHAAAGVLRKLRTSCLMGHVHRFQSFYETNADGTVRAGFSNGHLSDVKQARYITDPDWQSGFSAIEYDWSTGVFAVGQHLIVNGACRFRGKTYAG